MNSSIFPLLTLFLAHLHSRPTHFRRPSILIHTPQFRRPAYSYTPHNSGAPAYSFTPHISSVPAYPFTPHISGVSAYSFTPHAHPHNSGAPAYPFTPHISGVSAYSFTPHAHPHKRVYYTQKVPECIFTFEDFLQNLYRIYNRTTYYQNDLHIIRSSISEWPAYHGELR